MNHHGASPWHLRVFVQSNTEKSVMPSLGTTIARTAGVMKIRLTSLVLVLVLAGSASASLSLPFGADECDMHAGLSCSKAARTQSTTPEAVTAKLFCALSCAQKGTTSAPNVIRVSSPQAVRSPSHPAVTHSTPTQFVIIHRSDQRHGPPRNSEPAYLRNLTLLI